MKQIEDQKKQEAARKAEEERLAQQQRIEEEKEIQEAIDFERKDRRDTIKQNLAEEPAPGTPDVAQVAFRSSASGKRITRRFLKTDSIQTLYNFVRTLPEEDLGFDNPDADF